MLLPTGTYSNISRVNNIWYIENTPYPTPEPDITTDDATVLVAALSLVAIGFVAALLLSRRST